MSVDLGCPPAYGNPSSARVIGAPAQSSTLRPSQSERGITGPSVPPKPPWARPQAGQLGLDLVTRQATHFARTKAPLSPQGGQACAGDQVLLAKESDPVLFHEYERLERKLLEVVWWDCYAPVRAGSPHTTTPPYAVTTP